MSNSAEVLIATVIAINRVERQNHFMESCARMRPKSSLSLSFKVDQKNLEKEVSKFYCLVYAIVIDENVLT